MKLPATATLILVLTWGCSSDEERPKGNHTPSSGGSAGAAGSAGAGGDSSGGTAGTMSTGGTGGSGASGGTGGFGTGGAAGAGGSAGGGMAGAAGALGPTCESIAPNSLRFSEGDAEPVLQDWQVKSVGGSSEFFIVEYQGRGYAWYLGEFAEMPYSSPPGSYPISLGYLLAPTTTGNHGAVACFGAGSLEVDAFSSRIVSSTAKYLGQCPGTAVSGELELDSDPNGVTGSIEGVPVQATTVSLAIDTETETEAHLMFQNADFFLRVYTGALLTGTVQGDVASGILITHPDGAFDGAAYCLGSGSTWSYDEGAAHVQIPSLSKLGNCATEPGNAELLVCR